MKKWVLLEETKTYDGSSLTLHERDGTIAIRVDGRELMSTHHHHSELRLGELGCAHLTKRAGMRVLIGGLGLGFTLKAALAALAADAKVVVAEIMPEVVAWNRNAAYGLAFEALADRRTQIVMGDVADVITEHPSSFDTILLDADNNTTAMNTRGNKSLYRREGLEAVRAALRPGGRVVYWSVGEEPLFKKRMAKCGFKVAVEKVRSHATSGGLHTLLVGRV